MHGCLVFYDEWTSGWWGLWMLELDECTRVLVVL